MAEWTLLLTCTLLFIIVTSHAVGKFHMHGNLCLVACREEGRPHAVSGGNWRSLCGSNVDQRACTHAPFIILRMQRSMRKMLGLAIFPKAALKGVSSTSTVQPWHAVMMHLL